MDNSIVLWTCAICIFVYFLKHFLDRPRNLPPGPIGYPVLGSLLRLLPSPAKQLLEWSKLYGKTMSVMLGPRRMVVIHDYDVAKSVFSNDNTTGRDHKFILNIFLKGKGLLQSEGNLWREHRRFALSTLRDLGMGKSWLEDAILDEVQEFVDILKRSSGEAYNPRKHLTASVSNVICALVFGKRFDHTDTKFTRLCGLFGENARLFVDLLPVQLYPFLKYVPFGKFHIVWKLFFKNVFDVQAFGKLLISGHAAKVTVDRGDTETEQRDYIDGYFAEQRKQMGQKTQTSTFDDEQLLLSVLNLFAAGTETVTSSLLFAFLFMIENPDVKTKVQAEIDTNIGQDRTVRLTDKGSLKYTEATVLEIQRLASIVPLSVSHSNFERMKIDGYDVPARTLLQVNAYAMHRDPQYWKHPTRFYPEHFLDQEGAIHIPKGFIPFGIGKRACLGESLAKMELFLFFANIMQQFDINVTKNKTASSDHVSQTFLRSPHPYEVTFVSRNQALTDKECYRCL